MQQPINHFFRRWLALLSFVIGIGLGASAESVKIGELYYTLNTSTREAALTYQNTTSANYAGLSAELAIPATVVYNGVSFTVTSITDRAFANCTALQSISIPATVTQIGTANKNNAQYPYNTYLPFYNCTSLKSVQFEDGAQTIKLGSNCYNYADYNTGFGLFKSCPLEEVYIGRNIEYIDYSTSYPFANYPERYGYSAFYGQPKLAKVTIGPEVTKIPDYLFYQNAALTVLALPNVETIGNNAFAACSKLTTVNFGNNLKTLGNSAFQDCPNVTKLTLPSTTEKIGNSAFSGCTSITEVTVGAGLKSIGSNGFYNCSSFTALILPDGFTTMGEAAFQNCAKLTVAKLGNSLKAVPAKAFRDCPALSEIVFPATVQSVGDQAFYNDSGLATITMNEGLKTIGNEVFWNNSGIMQFTIPGTVTAMGTNCFYGCTRTTYLTFRDGSETLTINNSGGRSSKIEALSHYSTYTNRYYDYFYDCPIRVLTLGRNLKYSYSDAVSMYDYIENAFQSVTRASAPFVNHESLRSVTIGNQVTFLWHHLFDGCPNLTTVKFGNALGYIHTYAFNNCDKLPKAEFPASLRYLYKRAFSYCHALATVTFQDNNQSLSIGPSAFYQCPAITELTFPGQTVLVDDYAFANCANLQSTYFNDGVAGLQLQIKNRSFEKNPYLNTVRLPNHLISLGDYTYNEDVALEEIVIPNSVTSMGTYVFTKDSALKSAKLSTSCPWLREGVFMDCNSLLAITIPPVVTKMDTKLFANCRSLATVTFEGSTDLIEMAYGASQTDYGLFRNCPVETLNLDRWLSYNTEKPSRAPFYSISTLKNLNFGENVGVVDKYMFSYCTGLEEVYLPDNIESVGLWGFRGCSALKNVRFSQKLSQVSDYGFSGCTSLDNVVFPASMTSVADNSFSNCTSLKRLDLGQSLMIIGPSAFKGDTALEGIEIPSTLYGLGVEAFAGCTSLPNVAIKSISSVGKQAFQGCTGLQWVSLSSKTTSLGESSFDGCTGIKYIKSYAEFPPEGLVNFPAEVVSEATLFVPEYSVDYYQYSPTWEEWLTIRPLNDNILVAGISLDKTELNVKVSETTQLAATVANDDATDTGILWRVADDAVVSVDENGLVTAIALGETDVTALAADGSGQKAVCHVAVVPTKVESITLGGMVPQLKKGRTLALSAVVAPATATDPTLTWSSSNTSVATVDAQGVVTAKTAGSVIISASANDGSQIVATYAFTVIPPTKGDSNDNDAVTITDAVNTANYAAGNEVNGFCFEAADVDGNNRVTLADASATVSIVLEQPLASAPAKMRAAGIDADCDYLEIAAYASGETSEVGVKLCDTRHYVALQADILMPEGLTLENIALGNRAAASHTIATKRIDANTVRIAVFDLDNSAFITGDDAVISLTVKAAKNASGNILMSNILASDTSANEYQLSAIGGNNAETSAIDNVMYNGSIVIKAENNCVKVYNAQGHTVTVFNFSGITLRSFKAESAVEILTLANGIYIVTAGDATEKVMVK